PRRDRAAAGRVAADRRRVVGRHRRPRRPDRPAGAPRCRRHPLARLGRGHGGGRVRLLRRSRAPRARRRLPRALPRAPRAAAPLPARAPRGGLRRGDRARADPARARGRAGARGRRRVSHRMAAAVTAVWVAVVVIGLGTIALKGFGPVVLGGRSLPPAVARPLALLAPALLAALVVTQTLASGRHLVLDARLAGVGAAAVAIALRAPLVAVVLIAAVATAVVRLF